MFVLIDDGEPIFATEKKTLPIPGRFPGIRVEMIAHYVVVMLDAVGAKIKWDGKVSMHVLFKNEQTRIGSSHRAGSIFKKKML